MWFLLRTAPEGVTAWLSHVHSLRTRNVSPVKRAYIGHKGALIKVWFAMYAMFRQVAVQQLVYTRTRNKEAKTSWLPTLFAHRVSRIPPVGPVPAYILGFG